MDTDFLPPHAPLRSAASHRFSHATWHQSITLPSSSSSRPTYVTHLLPLSNGDGDDSVPMGGLLALTSDGDCHLLDAESLQPVDSWHLPGAGGMKGALAPSGKVSLTNVAKAPQGAGAGAGQMSGLWGVTDRTGKASLFDGRDANGRRRIGASQSMQVQTPTSSPLLSLSFSPSTSSAAPLLALGHELQSFDAPIYLYDLRNPSAPVITYDQSHSDDVTFLCFHPEKEGVLLSGSTDGLMTVYDVRQGADEDDAVLSAANSGASLARGGWLPGLMAAGAGEGDGMQVDGGDEENEATAAVKAMALGGIWGVSDMQTAGVWDAASTDPILPSLSALPGSTSTPAPSSSSSSSVARQYQADYIIDGFASSPSSSCSSSLPRLQLATGDQSGAFTLCTLPTSRILTEQQARSTPWTVNAFFPSLADSARGGHEDIVRSVCFSSSSGGRGRRLAWSGGEDGRVVAWSFEDYERDEEESEEGQAGDDGRMSALPSWAVGGSAGASGEGGVARRGGGVGGQRRGGGASSSSPSPAANGGRFRPYG